MNKYREKLKNGLKYNYLIIGAMALLLAFIMWKDVSVQGIADSRTASFMQGYRSGVLFGLIAAAVGYTVRILAALRNEESLKKLWVENTDERNILVDRQAGGISFKVSVMLLLIASVIASYFDFKVCMTLLGAVAAITLIRLVTCMIVSSQYR